MIVVAAVGAEQDEPRPRRAAAAAAKDAALLGPDQLREGRPCAADRAVATVPPVDVGKGGAPLGRRPKDRLQGELDELGERGRVIAIGRGGAPDRVGVPVQRVLEERHDVRRVGREPIGRALGRGSLEAGPAQVLREPAELGGDVRGIAGERAFSEQRMAGRDRRRRGVRGEIQRDVGRRSRAERGEPFLVERGDGPEARVLFRQLSPARASLVDLERGRNVSPERRRSPRRTSRTGTRARRPARGRRPVRASRWGSA